MTQNELKLVFDALQECTTYAVAGGFGKRATAHRDALAILEKALAQPEQEPFCFFYVENGEEYFAPKGAYVPDNAQPLYTTPPAAQPAVPDEITDRSESPEYRSGWNDCRALMLGNIT